VVVDGVGIAGAVVRVYSRELIWAREDSESMEPQMEVACDSLGAYTVEIQDQLLELFPTQTLFGETLSEGAPLADVKVKVRLQDYWDRDRNGSEWGLSFEPIYRKEVLSDSNGTFSVLAPSGACRVSGHKNGFESPLRGDIQAEDSPIVLSLRTKKEKGNYFHGIVRDPSGRPVAGAKVVAAPENKTAVSGPDGEFRLGPLEKAWGHPILAVAWKAGNAPNFTELDFAHPEKLVEIQLLPAFTIKGQLLDAEGEPIANGSIRLAGDGNPSIANNSSNPPSLFKVVGGSKECTDGLITNEQGRFEFGHLPQGEYQLTYEPSASSHSKDPQPAALAVAHSGDENVILQVGDLQGLELNFRGENGRERAF